MTEPDAIGTPIEADGEPEALIPTGPAVLAEAVIAGTEMEAAVWV